MIIRLQAAAAQLQAVWPSLTTSVRSLLAQSRTARAMALSRCLSSFMLILAVSCLAIAGLPASSRTQVALVYNGKYASGAADFEAALVRSGYDVHYFPRVRDLERIPASTAMIIFPGTDDNAGPFEQFIGGFTARSVESLRGFVQNGGRLLGVCGGAYLVSRDYRTEYGSGHGLSLLDIASIAYLADDSPTILDLQWKGRERPIYYQLGPKFLLSAGVQARVTATYADGSIAACIIRQGMGLYYLVGPHPEVLVSDLEQADIPDGSLNRLSDTSDLLDDILLDLGTKQ